MRKSSIFLLCLLVLVLFSICNLSIVNASPLLIQGNKKTETNSTTSHVITLSSTPTSGNVLILCVGVYHGSSMPSVTSISETNVAWSLQKRNQQYTHGGAPNDVEIWAGIIGSEASTSITVTTTPAVSGSSPFIISDVCEYSGLNTTDLLDKTATNYSRGGVNGDTGTTATTTQSYELWVGAIYQYYEGGQSSPTNSFTLLDGVKVDYDVLGFLYKIASATGTANSGVTFSVNTYGYVGCIATFKAVAYTPVNYKFENSETIHLTDSAISHAGRKFYSFETIHLSLTINFPKGLHFSNIETIHLSLTINFPKGLHFSNIETIYLSETNFIQKGIIFSLIEILSLQSLLNPSAVPTGDFDTGLIIGLGIAFFIGVTGIALWVSKRR